VIHLLCRRRRWRCYPTVGGCLLHAVADSVPLGGVGPVVGSLLGHCSVLLLVIGLYVGWGESACWVIHRWAGSSSGLLLVVGV
jgi:hypothetical protein